MIRDLVLKNRTYRRFDENVEIGREELYQMIDLARLSSSAANLQPMKYIVAGEADGAQVLPRE